MKIELKLYGDVALFSLLGELDSRGHQQLDKSLKEAINERVFKIVLDLSQIRFMGQQTISLLLSHMKELRANGGDVRFLNPQRPLMQYLKQNRVVELFRVFSTRSEAVDSFKVNNPNDLLPVKESSDSMGGEIFIYKPAEPSPSPDVTPSIKSDIKSRFETGEILYANSCMLATLIKMLEMKGMLSPDEAGDLMDYKRLSLKGVDE